MTEFKTAYSAIVILMIPVIICLFVWFFDFNGILRWLKRLRYMFNTDITCGYKGFKKDLTCKDMQYRENAEFIDEKTPVLCNHGFHFCRRLTDVFDYYKGDTDVYCPVMAFGSVVGSGHNDKRCTDAIRIGKRLTPSEIYAILLQENPRLPRDHKIIDLVFSGNTEREYFHRRLELIRRWLKRAENYMKRNSLTQTGNRKTTHGPSKGVVRIKGRLKRR